MRRRAVLIGLATALVVSGCSGDSAENGANSKDAAAAQSAAAAQTPSRLLTLRDVRAQPAGSPRRTIFRLWYWAQWGSSPMVAGSYHPRVLATVGVPTVVEAFAQQRVSMMQGRLKVEEEVTSPTGAFVGMSVARPEAETSFESYYLQRRGDAWVIAHDTFFERALANAVQSRAQLRFGRADEEPAPRAVAQGQRAAREFRALFSPGAPLPE